MIESVTLMARACCLVGAAPEDIPRLTAALAAAVASITTTVALLDIVMLNALAPDILVLDIDSLSDDPLETLRRLRFVLPDCVIVVFSGVLRYALLRECHSAGANCLLSKSSSVSQLAAGLRSAVSSGCFTDPRFVA